MRRACGRRSWTAVLSIGLSRQLLADGGRLRAAVQDVSYTAVRRRALSEAIIAELAARPPANDVRALLAVALPQLLAERHAAYAVVDQAVTAARAHRATVGAAGFVNALLRGFLRQRDEIVERLSRRRCGAVQRASVVDRPDPRRASAALARHPCRG